MQIIILIGPPGSGKGSLAALCIKQLGFLQLSTGNLCRQHVAENTEIGKKIDFAIKSGKLISDRLIIDMVDSWIAQLPKHVEFIILDGFPRTLVQAHLFNEFLAEKFPGDLAIHVVRINVSDNQVIARLLGRAICENKKCQAVYSLHAGTGLTSQRFMICDVCSSQLIKRIDDHEHTIRDRLITYHKHERELVNFYQKTGITVGELDGDQSLFDVFVQLKRLLHIEAA